jgi:hypothetical protein
MISARVDIGKAWGDEFARAIERQARIELERAMEEGAEVASQASLPRRRTGRMAQMDVLPVIPTPTGYQGAFRSRAFYAGFQSSGTGGTRKRKVRAATLRRRQTPSGQARQAAYGSRGITPLGFLEKGRSAARKSLVARLNRL